MHILFSILIWGAGAWAQEPAATQPQVPQPVAPAPVLVQAPAPTSVWATDYTKGWAWKRVGPQAAGGISGIAIHPKRNTIWAVVSEAGAVWVTVDGGNEWLEVLHAERSRLGSISNDEDVFLEVQAAVGDLVESTDGNFEDDAEEAASAMQSAVQDALTGVQSDLEGSGSWFDSGTPGGGSAISPKISFTPQGVLLVARAEGLFVSVDIGASWTKTLSEPITALASLSREFHLVGTPTGLLFSENLQDWFPIVELTDVGVFSLTVDGGVYAATTDGVWHAPEGWVWKKLAAFHQPSYSVCPIADLTELDRRTPRALVIGNEEQMVRSLGPMESASAHSVIGGPVRQSRDILRLSNELLVATSEDGPAQSVDQGRSWVPITAGLADPNTQALEASNGVLLLASVGGVFQMSPADKPPPQVKVPPWISMSTLINSAVSRHELTQKGGRRALAAIMPQLLLEGTYRGDVEEDWAFDTGTLHKVKPVVTGRVRLTWRPNRKQTGSGFDAEELPVVQIAGSTAVLDQAGLMAGYSATSRGAVAYRSELAQRVNQLFLTRARLTAEQSVEQGDKLIEKVTRQLQVAEVEAQLDALTEGMVSRYRADPTNQVGG